jgi:hypothetical protein
MGFLDRLLGRSAPPAPDLDRLFAVPEAAITLETALGLRPTGVGSVCYRAAEGGAFAAVQGDVTALLGAGAGPPVEQHVDAYGYTWLVVRRDAADVSGLVTDLHAVNSTLQDAGFGPALLCSLVGFGDDTARRLGLVYLYKRGTFYPFAPAGEQRRDNALELQVRGLVAQDLPVEAELGRWFPVWGAPGL